MINIRIRKYHLFVSRQGKIVCTFLARKTTSIKPWNLNICLTDIKMLIYSADITNHVEVTTAGWGMFVNYHDFKKDIDNAVRSTCMTNELGDYRYQYEACDLRELVSRF